MPTVSVILPAFDRVAFLRLAIDSVFAQTYSDWEMVVADDGSAAETRDFLRSIETSRVRIVWLAHSGNPSIVRNAAARAANGRYLAFLDSDDIWEPNKLDRQLEALRSRPQARWSYTACRHIDAGGAPLPKKAKGHVPMPEGWIFRDLLSLKIGIALPTVMTDRALFAEVGGFDAQQRFGEFHDVCLRLARSSEVVALRDQLSAIRVHDRHYSSDRVADRQGWVQLYEKMRALTDDADIRRLCDRMRADAALDLCGAYWAGGEHRSALLTLGHAVAFSWRFPQWWRRAFQRAVKSGFRRLSS